MAGLDMIKKFNNGGETSDSSFMDKAGDGSSSLPTSKAPTPKGKYQLPTPTGMIGVDKGILEEMQRLIAEKEAKKNSLAEAFADATAYWSGGVAGPGEALARRAEQVSNQEAELFGMRSQLAAQKSAQEAAKRKQESIFSALGRGPEGAPGAAAPSDPFAASIDPVVAERIYAIAQRDPDVAEKMLNTHLQEMAKISAAAKYAPTSYEPKIEVRPGPGQAYDVESLQERLAKQRGGMPPAAAAPAQAARPAAPAPAPSAAAPSTAVPSAPAAAAPAPGGIAPLQKLPPAPSPLQPKPAPAAAAAAPAAAAPAAAAPAAPTAGPRGNILEARAAQKESEVFREKAATGAAENVIKEQSTFEKTTQPTAVAERRRSAERVIDLATKYPEAIGILTTPGIANAALTAARDGLNTPSGAVGIRTIEDALVVAMPGSTREIINARKEIAQNLAKGALEASKLSEGQGTVSDFERLMFEKIAGSLADTPELLIKRQKMLAARAELDAELGEMYRRTKQPNKPLNYDAFRNSPIYEEKIKQYDAKLKQILDSDIQVGKGAAKGADLSQHPGMKLLNKYPKKTNP